MPISSDIEQLTYLQRRMLLSRLRLGLNHLKRQLSSAQLSEILQLGALPETQKASLYTNKIERLGNFIPLINTITTSLLGGWLGLSGFMQLHLNNMKVLIGILIATILTGGYLGYASYRSTFEQARQAISKQKLLNIELAFIQALRQKCQHSTQAIVKQINTKIAALNHANLQLQLLNLTTTQDQLSDWLLQFSQQLIQAALQFNGQVQHTYMQIVAKLQKQLVRLLKQHPKKIRQVKSDAIRALLQANPVLPIPKSHWLRDNSISILLVVTPTLLGGGASMFVYLCGIPDLSKAFGTSQWIPDSLKPQIKLVALGLAVSAALYFACSQAYANYKNYQRQREIKNIEQLIAEQEAQLLKEEAWFNLLRRLRGQIDRVHDVFSILQVLENKEPCLES